MCRHIITTKVTEEGKGVHGVEGSVVGRAAWAVPLGTKAADQTVS